MIHPTRWDPSIEIIVSQQGSYVDPCSFGLFSALLIIKQLHYCLNHLLSTQVYELHLSVRGQLVMKIDSFLVIGHHLCFLIVCMLVGCFQYDLAEALRLDVSLVSH